MTQHGILQMNLKAKGNERSTKCMISHNTIKNGRREKGNFNRVWSLTTRLRTEDKLGRVTNEFFRPILTARFIFSLSKYYRTPVMVAS